MVPRAEKVPERKAGKRLVLGKQYIATSPKTSSATRPPRPLSRPPLSYRLRCSRDLESQALAPGALAAPLAPEIPTGPHRLWLPASEAGPWQRKPRASRDGELRAKCPSSAGVVGSTCYSAAGHQPLPRPLPLGSRSPCSFSLRGPKAQVQRAGQQSRPGCADVVSQAGTSPQGSRWPSARWPPRLPTASHLCPTAFPSSSSQDPHPTPGLPNSAIPRSPPTHPRPPHLC